MSEPAKKSPCLGCINQKKDKLQPDSICYQCDKRILYDLSLIDSRLIPEYFTQDNRRVAKLKDISLSDSRKPARQTVMIDRQLDIMARKDGFDNYEEWLWYLHNKKQMPVSHIADRCNVGPPVIRKRIIDAGHTIINWKKSKEIKLKPCAYCGKIMQRKKFKDRLEDQYSYNKRECCSKKCSDLLKSFKSEKSKK